MDKQKQKRMVYIYEENLDFYESIENKSVWFNEQLQKARLTQPQTPANIEFVRKAVENLNKG